MEDEFIKERDKMIIDGNYNLYSEFCKKYNIPSVPNNEIFQITLHKCRCNINAIPKEMKKESQKWLEERGLNEL